jgi:hypothetical protein
MHVCMSEEPSLSPAPSFSLQVKFNLLLLECMSSAERWQEARRHVDALHRSLPLAKQKGPAASKALEALAGWRATCLVKAAAPGKALQDMPRLLSELSTPQAKVVYAVLDQVAQLLHSVQKCCHPRVHHVALTIPSRLQ